MPSRAFACAVTLATPDVRPAPLTKSPPPPVHDRLRDDGDLDRIQRELSAWCHDRSSPPEDCRREVRSLSPVGFAYLASRRSRLREPGFSLLYNGKTRVLALRRMSAAHNACQSFMLNLISRMKRQSFVRRQDFYEDADSDADSDAGTEADLLHSRAEFQVNDFTGDFKDSERSADWCLVRDHCSFPTLALELGLSQGYDSNDEGTGLVDRARLWLEGSCGRVHACVLACIDEDHSSNDAVGRFSGFVEVWRYNQTKGLAFRSGRRAFLPPHPPGQGARADTFTLKRSDLYGDHVPASMNPTATFTVHTRWLRRVLTKAYDVHVRNIENRRDAAKRKAEGDVGPGYEPRRRTN